MSTDRDNYAHTTESMYNQEWKQKYIVGYGSGIYIGSGPEALYIAKANNDQVNSDELCNLHIQICKEHNEAIRAGIAYKKKKVFFLVRLWRWIKLWFTPAFEYDYPADIDKDPDLNKYK